MDQLNTITDPTTSDNGFAQFCSANNLSIVVTSETEGNKVFTNLREDEAERIASRLFGYITGIDKAKPTILEQKMCIRDSDGRCRAFWSGSGALLSLHITDQTLPGSSDSSDYQRCDPRQNGTGAFPAL